MALNYDFEGIDNDLLINDSDAKPLAAAEAMKQMVKRKPLDGFTRSQYNIFTRNLEQCSQFG